MLVILLTLNKSENSGFFYFEHIKKLTFIFLTLNKSENGCYLLTLNISKKMEFIFIILNKSKKEWILFAEFEYVETVLFFIS